MIARDSSSRGRVFVVQEPVRREPNGDLVSSMDLTPARAFGDLVALLPPGSKPPLTESPQVVVDRLADQLATYDADHDFILPVGAPSIIGWAIAIAAGRSETGRVSVLQWERAARVYYPLTVELHPQESESEHDDG